MVRVPFWIQLHHPVPTWQVGAKPNALTRRPDVYPSGEGAYAKANAHNIQTVIQASQLFASFVLDTASALVLIWEGIQHDSFA